MKKYISNPDQNSAKIIRDEHGTKMVEKKPQLYVDTKTEMVTVTEVMTKFREYQSKCRYKCVKTTVMYSQTAFLATEEE